MIRDVHPGSKFFPIPDPRSGFRIQGSKKHRIRNTVLICNLSIGKCKSFFENKIRIIVGSRIQEPGEPIDADPDKKKNWVQTQFKYDTRDLWHFLSVWSKNTYHVSCQDGCLQKREWQMYHWHMDRYTLLLKYMAAVLRSRQFTFFTS